MNSFTIRTITLGGVLAAAGLAGAQTPPVSDPPSSSAAPHTAAPVSSGITAPVDPNKVVLAVGDTKITAAQFTEMTKSFPPQLQKALDSPQRRQVAESYVQLLAGAQEAEKRHLDQKPEVKQQLAIQRDQLLTQTLFQDILASVKITDADVQKYYDDHKTEFDTVKAQHILIRVKGSQVPIKKDGKDLTDAEALAKAQAVKKRLEAGEEFAKVQKEESDDTSGDLPEFSHGQMVKPFEDYAFSAPIGKISDPVKTQFGYHVIKVDSRKSKTMAEARPDIETKLKPEMARKEFEALKTKDNAIIDEDYFRAPAAATK